MSSMIILFFPLFLQTSLGLSFYSQTSPATVYKLFAMHQNPKICHPLIPIIWSLLLHWRMQSPTLRFVGIIYEGLNCFFFFPPGFWRMSCQICSFACIRLEWRSPIRTSSTLIWVIALYWISWIDVMWWWHQFWKMRNREKLTVCIHTW